MQKFAKIIRVITVAPIAAFIMLTLIYLITPECFGGTLHYAAAVCALTVLPLLAYPVSLVWKKEKRRDYQRSLAIDLSVAGYVAGFVFSLATGSPAAEKIIYLSYLISGAAIAVMSFVFKRKCSGHACGVAGPVSLLIYLVSPVFTVGLALLAPVFWASVKMKRHSLAQLVSGALIPVAAMAVSVLIFVH